MPRFPRRPDPAAVALFLFVLWVAMAALFSLLHGPT